MASLKEKFKQNSVPYLADVRKFVKENSDTVVSNVTLGQLYGGMRGVIGLVTETSLLDSENGISFRGYFIPDLYKNLPNLSYTKEPLPETLFHLLLTGSLPTNDEIEGLSKEWRERGDVPSYVFDVIRSMPKNTHPMTQFATAISALEHKSEFNKAYHSGVAKSDLWEYTYEDSMNIIAMLPTIAAFIYNYNYKTEDSMPKMRDDLDWAGNLALMLGDKGDNNSQFKEFMRLYAVLHSDHEGGNGSANACHAVGSTLASPYGAFASSMHSLSGPLHGLASQTALQWIRSLHSQYGRVPTKEEVADYINNILASGKVVPGYGHAVLRQTDPRFVAQMDFAKKHELVDDIIETVWRVYDVAPGILGSVGKIKNPYPNVDSHSGAILNYFGIKEVEFYTVLFGVARALGVLAQQIWDRAAMMPLHRPKSVTSEWVKSKYSN